MSKPVIRKVLAYITHRNRLLILRHTLAPEAGLQIPAGTLETGESPESGVLREAFEETGRTDLKFVAFLGEQMRDLPNEIHHRRFFHLCCTGEPPERWNHYESDPSDGSSGPIPFEFYWVDLPHDVPPMVADHHLYLPALLASLKNHNKQDQSL